MEKLFKLSYKFTKDGYVRDLYTWDCKETKKNFILTNKDTHYTKHLPKEELMKLKVFTEYPSLIEVYIITPKQSIGIAETILKDYIKQKVLKFKEQIDLLVEAL